MNYLIHLEDGRTVPFMCDTMGGSELEDFLVIDLAVEDGVVNAEDVVKVEKVS